MTAVLRRGIGIAGIVWAMAWMVSAADVAETKAAMPVLHLSNRDFVAGQLVESPDGRELRWQSPVFAAPVHYAYEAINAVHFPVPPQMPAATGDSRFELLGGDEFFGKLVALDDKVARIETSSFRVSPITGSSLNV